MVNSLGYLNWTLFKIGYLCWYMVTEGTQSYILVYRKVDVFDKVEKIPSKDFALGVETGEQKMSLHLQSFYKIDPQPSISFNFSSFDLLNDF